MKRYTITREEIYGDVWNWELTPEQLLTVNPDELKNELPELLKNREAEDGLPLDTVVKWYKASAAVVALARTDEEDDECEG